MLERSVETEFYSVVLFFFREVEPAAAFTYLPQARMVALAEAVEIGFGRVALQSAEYHKLWNRCVAQPHAAPQGLVHCFLVVHLAISHLSITLAVALAVLATLLDELLGRDELNARIFNVSAMNGLGVGMLAQ